ncbi:MAG: hypothetical protein IJ555_03670 [Ruminococcus sp.]|nr:hypothetical protein [Ruminococcus sp.]MBR1738682.1 hypothetical protein [Ruminococcus sp.]
MKLYRSLIYRELKLTRKRFLLMLILFLLLALLMLLPVFLGFFSIPADGENSPKDLIPVLVVTVALTGGLLAGTNNGIQKADISSGWKRYSFILPTTAKQQAVSDLLTKLCYIVLFGSLSAAFALTYTAIGDYNNLSVMLNVYFGAVCAAMLVDAAYSYTMMFANDKNQLKMISILSFVGAGAILKVVGLFPGFNKPEQPAEEGALISEEAINRLVSVLCSGKTTLCLLAAFAVICVLFFLVMWRSHERREP